MANPAPKLKEVPVVEAGAPIAVTTGSKKKKIIIALLVLVILGIAGGATAFFLQGNDNSIKKDVKKSKEKSAPAVFLPLDSFTVNLQSENDDKYLQAAISLQVRNEEQINYYKENMPQVRSRILLLLSSKSADELLTSEGKAKIIDEITKKIQLPYNKEELTPKEAEEHRILGVYFTSFVIQ